tara:strand:- start:17719 stop:33666 length:15948 start_codon:yes stop_codon:yes gene_type:complete
MPSPQIINWPADSASYSSITDVIKKASWDDTLLFAAGTHYIDRIESRGVDTASTAWGNKEVLMPGTIIIPTRICKWSTGNSGSQGPLDGHGQYTPGKFTIAGVGSETVLTTAGIGNPGITHTLWDPDWNDWLTNSDCVSFINSPPNSSFSGYTNDTSHYTAGGIFFLTSHDTNHIFWNHDIQIEQSQLPLNLSPMAVINGQRGDNGTMVSGFGTKENMERAINTHITFKNFNIQGVHLWNGEGAGFNIKAFFGALRIENVNINKCRSLVGSAISISDCWSPSGLSSGEGHDPYDLTLPVTGGKYTKFVRGIYNMVENNLPDYHAVNPDAIPLNMFDTSLIIRDCDFSGNTTCVMTTDENQSAGSYNHLAPNVRCSVPDWHTYVGNGNFCWNPDGFGFPQSKRQDPHIPSMVWPEDVDKIDISFGGHDITNLDSLFINRQYGGALIENCNFSDQFMVTGKGAQVYINRPNNGSKIKFHKCRFDRNKASYNDPLNYPPDTRWSRIPWSAAYVSMGGNANASSNYTAEGVIYLEDDWWGSDCDYIYSLFSPMRDFNPDDERAGMMNTREPAVEFDSCNIMFNGMAYDAAFSTGSFSNNFRVTDCLIWGNSGFHGAGFNLGHRMGFVDVVRSLIARNVIHERGFINAAGYGLCAYSSENSTTDGSGNGVKVELGNWFQNSQFSSINSTWVHNRMLWIEDYFGTGEGDHTIDNWNLGGFQFICQGWQYGITKNPSFINFHNSIVAGNQGLYSMLSFPATKMRSYNGLNGDMTPFGQDCASMLYPHNPYEAFDCASGIWFEQNLSDVRIIRNAHPYPYDTYWKNTITPNDWVRMESYPEFAGDSEGFVLNKGKIQASEIKRWDNYDETLKAGLPSWNNNALPGMLYDTLDIIPAGPSGPGIWDGDSTGLRSFSNNLRNPNLGLINQYEVHEMSDTIAGGPRSAYNLATNSILTGQGDPNAYLAISNELGLNDIGYHLNNNNLPNFTLANYMDHSSWNGGTVIPGNSEIQQYRTIRVISKFGTDIIGTAAEPNEIVIHQGFLAADSLSLTAGDFTIEEYLNDQIELLYPQFGDTTLWVNIGYSSTEIGSDLVHLTREVLLDPSYDSGVEVIGDDLVLREEDYFPYFTDFGSYNVLSNIPVLENIFQETHSLTTFHTYMGANIGGLLWGDSQGRFGTDFETQYTAEDCFGQNDWNKVSVPITWGYHGFVPGDSTGMNAYRADTMFMMPSNVSISGNPHGCLAVQLATYAMSSEGPSATYGNCAALNGTPESPQPGGGFSNTGQGGWFMWPDNSNPYNTDKTAKIYKVIDNRMIEGANNIVGDSAMLRQTTYNFKVVYGFMMDSSILNIPDYYHGPILSSYVGFPQLCTWRNKDGKFQIKTTTSRMNTGFASTSYGTNAVNYLGTTTDTTTRQNPIGWGATSAWNTIYWFEANYQATLDMPDLTQGDSPLALIWSTKPEATGVGTGHQGGIISQTELDSCQYQQFLIDCVSITSIFAGETTCETRFEAKIWKDGGSGTHQGDMAEFDMHSGFDDGGDDDNILNLDLWGLHSVYKSYFQMGFSMDIRAKVTSIDGAIQYSPWRENAIKWQPAGNVGYVKISGLFDQAKQRSIEPLGGYPWEVMPQLHYGFMSDNGNGGKYTITWDFTEAINQTNPVEELTLFAYFIPRRNSAFIEGPGPSEFNQFDPTWMDPDLQNRGHRYPRDEDNSHAKYGMFEIFIDKIPTNLGEFTFSFDDFLGYNGNPSANFDENGEIYNAQALLNHLADSLNFRTSGYPHGYHPGNNYQADNASWGLDCPFTQLDYSGGVVGGTNEPYNLAKLGFRYMSEAMTGAFHPTRTAFLVTDDDPSNPISDYQRMGPDYDIYFSLEPSSYATQLNWNINNPSEYGTDIDQDQLTDWYEEEFWVWNHPFNKLEHYIIDRHRYYIHGDTSFVKAADCISLIPFKIDTHWEVTSTNLDCAAPGGYVDVTVIDSGLRSLVVDVNTGGVFSNSSYDNPWANFEGSPKVKTEAYLFKNTPGTNNIFVVQLGTHWEDDYDFGYTESHPLNPAQDVGLSSRMGITQETVRVHLAPLMSNGLSPYSINPYDTYYIGVTCSLTADEEYRVPPRFLRDAPYQLHAGASSTLLQAGSQTQGDFENLTWSFSDPFVIEGAFGTGHEGFESAWRNLARSESWNQTNTFMYKNSFKDAVNLNYYIPGWGWNWKEWEGGNVDYYLHTMGAFADTPDLGVWLEFDTPNLVDSAMWIGQGAVPSTAIAYDTETFTNFWFSNKGIYSLLYGSSGTMSFNNGEDWAKADTTMCMGPPGNWAANDLDGYFRYKWTLREDSLGWDNIYSYDAVDQYNQMVFKEEATSDWIYYAEIPQIYNLPGICFRTIGERNAEMKMQSISNGPSTAQVKEGTIRLRSGYDSATPNNGLNIGDPEFDFNRNVLVDDSWYFNENNREWNPKAHGTIYEGEWLPIDFSVSGACDRIVFHLLDEDGNMVQEASGNYAIMRTTNASATLDNLFNNWWNLEGEQYTITKNIEDTLYRESYQQYMNRADEGGQTFGNPLLMPFSPNVIDTIQPAFTFNWKVNTLNPLTPNANYYIRITAVNDKIFRMSSINVKDTDIYNFHTSCTVGPLLCQPAPDLVVNTEFGDPNASGNPERNAFPTGKNIAIGGTFINAVEEYQDRYQMRVELWQGGGKVGTIIDSLAPDMAGLDTLEFNSALCIPNIHQDGIYHDTAFPYSRYYSKANMVGSSMINPEWDDCAVNTDSSSAGYTKYDFSSNAPIYPLAQLGSGASPYSTRGDGVARPEEGMNGNYPLHSIRPLYDIPGWMEADGNIFRQNDLVSERVYTSNEQWNFEYFPWGAPQELDERAANIRYKIEPNGDDENAWSHFGLLNIQEVAFSGKDDTDFFPLVPIHQGAYAQDSTASGLYHKSNDRNIDTTPPNWYFSSDAKKPRWFIQQIYDATETPNYPSQAGYLVDWKGTTHCGDLDIQLKESTIDPGHMYEEADHEFIKAFTVMGWVYHEPGKGWYTNAGHYDTNGLTIANTIYSRWTCGYDTTSDQSSGLGWVNNPNFPYNANDGNDRASNFSEGWFFGTKLGSPQFGLFIDQYDVSDGTTTKYECYVDDDNLFDKWYSGGATFKYKPKWYHMAASYDGRKGTMRVWINGECVAAKDRSAGDDVPFNIDSKIMNPNLYKQGGGSTHRYLYEVIGNRSKNITNNRYSIKGALGEVKTFNRALSTWEIKYFMKGQFFPVYSRQDLELKFIPFLPRDGSGPPSADSYFPEASSPSGKMANRFISLNNVGREHPKQTVNTVFINDTALLNTTSLTSNTYYGWPNQDKGPHFVNRINLPMLGIHGIEQAEVFPILKWEESNTDQFGMNHFNDSYNWPSDSGPVLIDGDIFDDVLRGTYRNGWNLGAYKLKLVKWQGNSWAATDAHGTPKYMGGTYIELMTLIDEVHPEEIYEAMANNSIAFQSNGDTGPFGDLTDAAGIQPYTDWWITISTFCGALGSHFVNSFLHWRDWTFQHKFNDADYAQGIGNGLTGGGGVIYNSLWNRDQNKLAAYATIPEDTCYALIIEGIGENSGFSDTSELFTIKNPRKPYVRNPWKSGNNSEYNSIHNMYGLWADTTFVLDYNNEYFGEDFNTSDTHNIYLTKQSSIGTSMFGPGGDPTTYSRPSWFTAFPEDIPSLNIITAITEGAVSIATWTNVSIPYNNPTDLDPDWTNNSYYLEGTYGYANKSDIYLYNFLVVDALKNQGFKKPWKYTNSTIFGDSLIEIDFIPSENNFFLNRFENAWTNQPKIRLLDGASFVEPRDWNLNRIDTVTSGSINDLSGTGDEYEAFWYGPGAFRTSYFQIHDHIPQFNFRLPNSQSGNYEPFFLGDTNYYVDYGNSTATYPYLYGSLAINSTIEEFGSVVSNFSWKFPFNYDNIVGKHFVDSAAFGMNFTNSNDIYSHIYTLGSIPQGDVDLLNTHQANLQFAVNPTDDGLKSPYAYILSKAGYTNSQRPIDTWTTTDMASTWLQGRFSDTFAKVQRPRLDIVGIQQDTEFMEDDTINMQISSYYPWSGDSSFVLQIWNSSGTSWQTDAGNVIITSDYHNHQYTIPNETAQLLQLDNRYTFKVAPNNMNFNFIASGDRKSERWYLRNETVSHSITVTGPAAGFNAGENVGVLAGWQTTNFDPGELVDVFLHRTGASQAETSLLNQPNNGICQVYDINNPLSNITFDKWSAWDNDNIPATHSVSVRESDATNINDTSELFYIFTESALYINNTLSTDIWIQDSITINFREQGGYSEAMVQLETSSGEVQTINNYLPLNPTSIDSTHSIVIHMSSENITLPADGYLDYSGVRIKKTVPDRFVNDNPANNKITNSFRLNNIPALELSDDFAIPLYVMPNAGDTIPAIYIKEEISSNNLLPSDLAFTATSFGEGAFHPTYADSINIVLYNNGVRGDTLKTSLLSLNTTQYTEDIKSELWALPDDTNYSIRLECVGDTNIYVNSKPFQLLSYPKVIWTSPGENSTHYFGDTLAISIKCTGAPINLLSWNREEDYNFWNGDMIPFNSDTNVWDAIYSTYDTNAGSASTGLGRGAGAWTIDTTINITLPTYWAGSDHEFELKYSPTKLHHFVGEEVDFTNIQSFIFNYIDFWHYPQITSHLFRVSSDPYIQITNPSGDNPSVYSGRYMPIQGMTNDLIFYHNTGHDFFESYMALKAELYKGGTEASNFIQVLQPNITTSDMQDMISYTTTFDDGVDIPGPFIADALTADTDYFLRVGYSPNNYFEEEGINNYWQLVEGDCARMDFTKSNASNVLYLRNIPDFVPLTYFDSSDCARNCQFLQPGFITSKLNSATDTNSIKVALTGFDTVPANTVVTFQYGLSQFLASGDTTVCLIDGPFQGSPIKLDPNWRYQDSAGFNFGQGTQKKIKLLTDGSGGDSATIKHVSSSNSSTTLNISPFAFSKYPDTNAPTGIEVFKQFEIKNLAQFDIYDPINNENITMAQGESIVVQWIQTDAPFTTHFYLTRNGVDIHDMGTGNWFGASTQGLNQIANGIFKFELPEESWVGGPTNMNAQWEPSTVYQIKAISNYENQNDPATYLEFYSNQFQLQGDSHIIAIAPGGLHQDGGEQIFEGASYFEGDTITCQWQNLYNPTTNIELWKLPINQAVDGNWNDTSLYTCVDTIAQSLWSNFGLGDSIGHFSHGLSEGMNLVYGEGETGYYKWRFVMGNQTGASFTKCQRVISKPAIIISQPSSGDNWRPGTIQEILFGERFPAGNYCRIDLYYNGTPLWVITENQRINEGRHEFILPANMATGAHFQIGITYLDLDPEIFGQPILSLSDKFSISDGGELGIGTPRYRPIDANKGN